MSTHYLRYDPQTESILDVIRELFIELLTVGNIEVIGNLTVDGMLTLGNALTLDSLVVNTSTQLYNNVEVDTLLNIAGESEIAVNTNIVLDDGYSIRADRFEADIYVKTQALQVSNILSIDTNPVNLVGNYDMDTSNWVSLPSLQADTIYVANVLSSSVYNSGTEPTFKLSFMPYKINNENWVKVKFYDFNIENALITNAAATFVGFVSNAVVPSTFWPKGASSNISGFSSFIYVKRPGITVYENGYFKTVNFFILGAGYGTSSGGVFFDIPSLNNTSDRPVGTLLRIPDQEFNYKIN